MAVGAGGAEPRRVLRLRNVGHIERVELRSTVYYTIRNACLRLNLFSTVCLLMRPRPPGCHVHH